MHWGEALMALCKNDEKTFDDALYAAVLAHHTYWIENAVECRYQGGIHPEGFVCLGVTALASIGFDRGLQNNLDSEYLPMDLVRGEDNGIDPFAGLY